MGLLADLKQYFVDAMPGGDLNPEWTPSRQAEAWNQAQNFTPVWGGIKGAGEEWEAGNPGWAAFNAATVPLDLMGAGILGTVARGAVKGGRAADALTSGQGLLKYTDYPKVGKPVKKTDPKTGKEFMTKGPSAEAREVEKIRKQAQAEINAGTAPQYFNLQERYYADPSNYGEAFDTTTLLPKKQETVDKWLQRYDTPEARARLQAGYELGRQDPNAIDWYAMGQLQDAFRAKYGVEEGDRLFKERFADSMAATTGGADPTANLLMAHYGNQLKTSGQALPAGAYEMPYPIGGRYAMGNMKQFEKHILQNPIPGIDAPNNPKRYDFSRNFLGDLDRATIDEQMMGAFGVPEKAPTYYGAAELPVRDLAAQAGVPAANYQDAAWAGLKALKGDGTVQGKPMMSHINDMLYRTSQVTGETMEQVLNRFMEGKGAMYSGLLGVPAAGYLAAGTGRDDSI